MLDETVAVVVVTYHSEALLDDLIGSLGPGLAGVPWHLTVADNASADGTVSLVRRLAPDATVVEMGRNAGYAAGINAAVVAARPHTAILALNPDVRLAPGFVGPLLAALREPGTGIAVPRLSDGDGALIHSMRRAPTVLRAVGDAVLGAVRAGRYPALGEMVTDPRLYETGRLTDWAEGSTQLISASCWDACGPWDESYFLYSEETDFALRARDAGFACRYTPTARAVHLEGASQESSPLWTLLVLNKIRLYGRRHGPLPTFAYWAALVVREGSRAVLGRRPSRAATRALLSPTRLRTTPSAASVARAAERS